ncbi:hypothetical protein EVAR_69473_1 [Eumeta japonica]|uniref:Uncharacterized protein n=1 Tax=Eumeta variegata TaxID=151549 RepID=A0A4C1SF25_EUMVA|nr:hypothetical protein EVAR_69473_1 [Eumeta japonica]
MSETIANYFLTRPLNNSGGAGGFSSGRGVLICDVAQELISSPSPAGCATFHWRCATAAAAGLADIRYRPRLCNSSYYHNAKTYDPTIIIRMRDVDLDPSP